MMAITRLLPTSIFDFSFFPDFQGALAKLASTAMPESWHYRNPKHEVFGKCAPVLERYILNTYKANAIAYNEAAEESEKNRHFAFEEGWACFNTGLITPLRENIYALFSINNMQNRTTEWYFKGFWNESARCVENIKKLPQKIAFDQSQMIFHPDWEIRINYRHILEDNVLRLPEEIRMTRYAPLLIKGSTEYARELARVEPSVVAPQFYDGKVHFLLPLHLTDMNRYDVAMSLVPNDGFYIGCTILPLSHAYSNARILGRPSARWLLELVENGSSGGWNEPRFEYGGMPYI